MKYTLNDPKGNMILSVESTTVTNTDISVSMLKEEIKKIDISNFKTSNVKAKILSIANEKYICNTPETVYVDFDVIKITRTVGDEIVSLTNKIVDILNKTDFGKKLVFTKISQNEGFYIYDSIAEHESDSYDSCINRKNIKTLKLEVNKTVKEKLDIVHANQKKHVDDILNKLSGLGVKRAGDIKVKKYINPCDEWYNYIVDVSGLSKYLALNTDNASCVAWPVKDENGYYNWMHDPNEEYAPIEFAKNNDLYKLTRDYKKMPLPKDFSSISIEYRINFDFGSDFYCWVKHKRSIEELIKLNGSEKFLRGIRNSIKDFDKGMCDISFHIEYNL